MTVLILQQRPEVVKEVSRVETIGGEVVEVAVGGEVVDVEVVTL